MENNNITPQLNLDPQRLRISHSFNCPSRDTSENIVIKRHTYIKDAKLVFCADCGNPLCTLSDNNSFIGFIWFYLIVSNRFI